MKRYIHLLPILQVIATVVVSFITVDDKLFVLLGNTVGYSVFTSLVYLAFFWNKKYCWFTKLSCLGLLFMSIINLIGYFLSYEIYVQYFDTAVFVIVAFCALALEGVNKLRNNSKKDSVHY